MSLFVCKNCGKRVGEDREPTNPPTCTNCGEKMLPALFTENGRDAAFNDDRNAALAALQQAVRDVGTYYRYWCHGHKYVGEMLNNMRKLLAIIEADSSRKEKPEEDADLRRIEQAMRRKYEKVAPPPQFDAREYFHRFMESGRNGGGEEGGV